MKKIVSLFVSLFVFMSVSAFAFAADLSDGIYEVPVVLMHKEDEKESFGNKYVAQTALLEVENGKKTITILLETDMDGIEFSYYTDGSLSGDVEKGTSVSNVTVAGQTYKQGFEVPVMSEGDIGLQFSVPVMPMSPSARLRIDYSNAVKLTASDTTVALETETVVTTTEPVTQVPETTEVYTSAEATVAVVTYAESTTVLQPATSYEETTYTYVTESAQETETNEAISSVVMRILGLLIAIILVAFVITIILVVVIVVVKKKKMNRVKNNDDK